MLLDTTFLIDFLRAKKEAIEFLESHQPIALFTTEINVFELFTGAYLFDKNVDDHTQKITSLLSKLNVLPLDRKASIKAGEIAAKLIKEGKKIEETDCLIAAIAIINGINKIVTANKSHYERIKGIEVISY